MAVAVRKKGPDGPFKNLLDVLDLLAHLLN